MTVDHTLESYQFQSAVVKEAWTPTLCLTSRVLPLAVRVCIKRDIRELDVQLASCLTALRSPKLVPRQL